MRLLRQLELLFPTSSRSSNRTRKRVRPTKTLRSRRTKFTPETPMGHDLFPQPLARSQGRVDQNHSRGKSDEFLLTLWRNLRQEFFPDHIHIDDYTVTWSSRPQKRVLASCNIRRRRIVVAQELFEPSATRWIGPVLYHEMCHAVIGEGVHLSQSGKRLWHGQQFRQLESLHPDISAMNAWIATGGWAMAVRSHRARQSWRARNRVR